MHKEHYTVAIIGAGVVGTAITYALSKYTDLKDILLLEKHGDVAQLNSNSVNNSQTLHSGEIETNYSIEKIKETRKAANMVLNYSRSLPKKLMESIIQPCQKMVLGVGDEEIELLNKHYSQEFKDVFPYVKQISKDEIGKYEPNLLNGRDPDENLVALFSKEGYMVDYYKLSKSFLNQALESKKTTVDVHFNESLKRLDEAADLYSIKTDKGHYTADFVVCAAGAYSLFFAKSLGYGKNLGILSVGGNFFSSKRVLNGKIYRVEKEGIPFAAVHGDPDITNPKITRFGPTVSVYPYLEKNNRRSMFDYMRSLGIDAKTIVSLEEILSYEGISKIIMRNFGYALPRVGKEEFIKNEVKKIVPSLEAKDIKFDKGVGGIRPQIIDKDKHALVMGGSAITGKNIIFNVTPSPGATSCLSEAMSNIQYLVKSLDIAFDSDGFSKDLIEPTEKSYKSANKD